jgi:Fe-S oxidoreductase
MARMKIEVTALQTEKHGLSWHDKLIAYLPDYAPYAAALAPLLRLRDLLPGAAWLSEKITGFTAKRPLPKWQRNWFRQDELPPQPAADATPVILFADTFNRYLEPENLRAAVRVLQAAGYAVFAPMPEQSNQPLCCGRTFLSTGMVERARSEANRLVTTFMPFATAGVPIVGLEPSCLLALRDELPALLNDEASRIVAGMAMTFEELLAHDKPALPLKKAAGKALLHGHCHQKAFDAVRPIEEVLGWIDGLDVTPIESSCCGMAGAFGYSAESYDISMQMANENLLPAIRKADADDLLIADGTSCRCQIKDGTNRTAKHVALVLDSYLEDTKPAN